MSKHTLGLFSGLPPAPPSPKPQEATMSDQPEALFIADVIAHAPQSRAHHHAAVACLRRQHAEIAALKAECDALREALVSNAPTVGMGWIDRAKKAEAERDALRAERGALLEFARAVARYAGSAGDDYLAEKARAAIAKAGGNDE